MVRFGICDVMDLGGGPTEGVYWVIEFNCFVE